MKLIPPTADIDVDDIEEQQQENKTLIQTVLDTQIVLNSMATPGMLREAEAIALLAATGENFIVTLTESMSRVEDAPNGYPAVLALTAILRGAEVAVANLTQLTFDGQSAQGETTHEGTDGHASSGGTASVGHRKTRGRRRSATASQPTTRGRDRSSVSIAGKRKSTAVSKRTANTRPHSRTGGRKAAVKKSGKKR